MAEMDDIILAHPLHIREAIDGVRNDIRQMMRPIGKPECHCANMSDWMDVPIERIELRLDLTEV